MRSKANLLSIARPPSNANMLPIFFSLNALSISAKKKSLYNLAYYSLSKIRKGKQYSQFTNSNSETFFGQWQLLKICVVYPFLF